MNIDALSDAQRLAVFHREVAIGLARHAHAAGLAAAEKAYVDALNAALAKEEDEHTD